MNYLIYYYVKINIFYGINSRANIVPHWEKYESTLVNISNAEEAAAIIKDMYPGRQVRIESIQELGETPVPEIKIIQVQDKVNEYLKQIPIKK